MFLPTLAVLGLAGLAVAAPKADTNAVNKRYVEERNGVSYNVSIGWSRGSYTHSLACGLRNTAARTPMIRVTADTEL